MDAKSPTVDPQWYLSDVASGFIRLESSENGLSNDEAQRRLNLYGENVIQSDDGINPLKLFFSQFTSLVVLILIGAAVVSATLGEWTDSSVILFIVVMNGIVGFLQEFQAEKSIQALKKMAAPQCQVWRDGKLVLLPARLIVPGDVVKLEEGDWVPADARLTHDAAFMTVEAALTGESLPILKSAAAVLAAATPLAEQNNMVFMGTSVAHGSALALICATGMKTELGKIAHLIETADEGEQTPLQKSLENVSKRLVLLCLGIVLGIFAAGVLRGFSLVDMFLTAISLAVAAIPEGLPAVVTVALALGVKRMVKRHALMRRLPTVETLGAANVICTDKTGTLTLGEMTVRELFTDNRTFFVSGEGYAPTGSMTPLSRGEADKKALQNLMTLFVACNNARLQQKQNAWEILGDPTEAALLTAAQKIGINQDDVNASYPKTGENPFDSDRKRMSVLRTWGEDQRLLVKGAVDVLLPKCSHIATEAGIHPLTSDERENLIEITNHMAARALRVLGAAYREMNDDNKKLSIDAESDLIWVGMAAMVDPPRPEAKAAIKRCHSAGVRVVMITGDHPVTAHAIACELGILQEKAQEKSQVMSGAQLDALDTQTFANRIPSISVFARVTAEHKMRIVKALKADKSVVAMTGDGVNDAPAIKAADIGIAMGKSGTEVTKQSADMIVTDDNFASIVAAIEEGRSVYENIKKTLQYLLAGNLGELLFVAIAVLSGLPMPLLPVHLLWINLITDGLPALALATDPVDPTLMKKPPRHAEANMLSRSFFIKVGVTGMLTAGVTLISFIHCVVDHSIEQARTVAFATLIFAELFRVFGVRNEEGALDILGNPRLFVVVLIALLIQPWWWPFEGFQRLLRSVPLGWDDITLSFCLGLIPLIALKLIQRSKYWPKD